MVMLMVSLLTNDLADPPPIEIGLTGLVLTAVSTTPCVAVVVAATGKLLALAIPLAIPCMV